MGGVFLSIGFVHSFNQNMTAGRGFIGLAARHLRQVASRRRARRRAAVRLLERPGPAAARLLAEHGALFQALPYVLTLIAVAGLVGRSRPPAADGIPYERW